MKIIADFRWLPAVALCPADTHICRKAQAPPSLAEGHGGNVPLTTHGRSVVLPHTSLVFPQYTSGALPAAFLFSPRPIVPTGTAFQPGKSVSLAYPIKIYPQPNDLVK